MKKINVKIANKLGEKFKEANIQKNVNSTEVLEVKEKYNPILNYDEFELENLQKEQMIIFEEKAIHHANELSKNTIALSKIFYEAQKTLAFAGSGLFTKWYETLGFKKDFVYMLLKRNELFMEVENKRIFEIPEKAIKTISKIKDKVDVKEILEIVNAEKPVVVAKEIEVSLSGNPKDRLPEIGDIEILENDFNKIIKLERKIAEYYQKIKDLEYELSILKKSR
ncbi:MULTISPECIES: hypothetical protein [Cetobacterium]|jgi:hypothetical protein|uniref:Uncharacterized protein n=1 Tax=Candidatus Cetobacterium colombiensis TaxID=3073100 RepID=A0ABU4WCI9_9FUSO|nr:hypothetical protein [Candidatus Cetobacterium colombiensis]MDX8337260.1 hypothetical protein [Candidatus Cetobacterium colombiensis]